MAMTRRPIAVAGNSLPERQGKEELDALKSIFAVCHNSPPFSLFPPLHFVCRRTINDNFPAIAAVVGLGSTWRGGPLRPVREPPHSSRSGC